MKKVLFDEQARQDLSSQHHHHHNGKYYTNTTRHRSLETFSQYSFEAYIKIFTMKVTKVDMFKIFAAEETYLDKK